MMPVAHALWVVLCAGVLAACGGAAATLTPDAAPSPAPAAAAALKRVWVLTEWPGYHRERLQAARAQMDWRQLPQAGAHMGCNRLMFRVEAEPVAAHGRLRIGPVAATRMYCAEHMDLEQAFGQLIGSFTRYRVQGRELILDNDQGQSLRWMAQDGD